MNLADSWRRQRLHQECQVARVGARRCTGLKCPGPCETALISWFTISTDGIVLENYVAFVVVCTSILRVCLIVADNLGCRPSCLSTVSSRIPTTFATLWHCQCGRIGAKASFSLRPASTSGNTHLDALCSQLGTGSAWRALPGSVTVRRNKH